MKVLRPYQNKAKDDVYLEWRYGNRNVLLVMPTGGGKTVTFCSIAIDFAVCPKNKSPTAIMVHRKELVQQISLTLAAEGVMHNIIAPRPVILGIVGAHRRVLTKSFYDHAATVSVISVDTLNSRITHHMTWAKGIKLWILDEAAHLIEDNKWGRAISFFPNAIGLGVTATPDRLDGKGLGRHHDGLFDVMVEGPNTKWMINNGYLCQYKVAAPPSDFNDFLKPSSSKSDYSKAAMAKASEESKITGDVVKEYIKHASGKQCIVFTTDLKTGRRMAEKFKAAGIKASFLSSESSDKERLDDMLDFADKKIQVLINVDLFDEGLDVPGIECVSMARPTMSLAKFLQMIGRGLRIAEGKEFLIIIDHVGNIKRHLLPCTRRQWTLDRRVKKRKIVDLMTTCLNPMCQSPYDRTETKCPWCGEPAFVNQAGGGAGRTPPEQVDGDLILIDPETMAEMAQATELESPADTGKRVAAAAGGPAGIKAMNNQVDRIETQGHLGLTIANWAGVHRDDGMVDRSIHKKFFIENGRTINQALAEPKADMNKLIKLLGGEV